MRKMEPKEQQEIVKVTLENINPKLACQQYDYYGGTVLANSWKRLERIKGQYK